MFEMTISIFPLALLITGCNPSSKPVDATGADRVSLNGAYQMGLADEQGSIEVSKRAELVVPDRILFELTPSEINEARVVMTVFDGRTVYE